MNKISTDLLASTLHEVVNKICNAILARVYSDDPTLLNGLPGALLALGYIRKCAHQNIDIDEALESGIDQLIDQIETITLDGSLFYGVTGIAHTLRTLFKLGLLPIDKDEFEEWLAPLDERILDAFNTNIKLKNYDLLKGAIGQVVYFLEFNKNRASINSFVDFLQDHAVKDGNGLYWYGYIYDDLTKKYEIQTDKINFGLAHGIPSILAILSKIYSNNIRKESCEFLIRGVCRWISSKQDGNQLSSFPIFLCSDSVVGKGLDISSVSWCYGDLSVGIPLLKAGMLLNDSEIIKLANETIKKTLPRDINDSYIKDHGFCHGFWGATHLYDFLNSITSSDSYEFKVQYWLEQAYLTRDFKVNETGFFKLQYQDEDNKSLGVENVTNLGLLEGLSGIALAISSIIYKYRDWNSIFLLK